MQQFAVYRPLVLLGVGNSVGSSWLTSREPAMAEKAVVAETRATGTAVAHSGRVQLGVMDEQRLWRGGRGDGSSIDRLGDEPFDRGAVL